MNRHDELLNRLAARARKDASSPALVADVELPLGLPTRVLATVRGQRNPSALWERLALRTVPAAALAVLLCLWLTPQPSVRATTSPEDMLATDIFTQLLLP